MTMNRVRTPSFTMSAHNLHDVQIAKRKEDN